MSITGVNNIQTILPVSKIPYLKNINALNNISEEQRQEFRQKTIKTALIASASSILLLGGALMLFRTGKLSKGVQKLSVWTSESQSIPAKLIREYRNLNKINVQISDEAFDHFRAKTKNINGLNKDGVYGAHEMSAFIKAFFPQKTSNSILSITIHPDSNQMFNIKYMKDGETAEKIVYIGQEISGDNLAIFKDLCSADVKKANKKLFKRIMNNPSKTIDITPPKEAEEMSSFLGRLNEIKPNGEILEVIQDPMNNGIWDILYRKNADCGILHKTVYMNAPLDDKTKDMFRQLFDRKNSISSFSFKDICSLLKNSKGILTIQNMSDDTRNLLNSKNIDFERFHSKESFEKFKKLLKKRYFSKDVLKSSDFFERIDMNSSPVDNLLGGKFVCSDERMKEMAQKAFEKGVILPSKNGKQQIIIGKQNGILFTAFGAFDKETKTFLIDKSFFPLSHGNDMHENLIQTYMEEKGKLNLLNLPLFIGIKGDKLLDRFLLNTVFSISSKAAIYSSGLVGSLCMSNAAKQNMATNNVSLQKLA